MRIFLFHQQINKNEKIPHTFNKNIV